MKKFLIASVIMFLLFMPQFSSGLGHRGEAYLLFIPDANEQYHNGMKVFVAGVEQNLTVPRYSENVTVVMYYANFTEKNYKSYYKWSYRNGMFYDDLYGKYINLSSCTASKDKLSFHIWISSDAEGSNKSGGEIWVLLVLSGSDRKIEDNVYVEIATVDFAASTPVFHFSISPSTEGTNIKPEEGDYFRTINHGNLPLRIFAYNSEMISLNISNMSRVLLPDSQEYHRIYLNSLPWSPQIIEVKEHIRAVPLHLMSTKNVYFKTALSAVVKVIIKVVRPGFDIIDIGNAKLQYEPSKVAKFDEVLPLTLYLSGNGTAYLNITPKDLLIKGVYYDGVWHNSTRSSTVSIKFKLRGGDEKEIRVVVRCYKEKVNAVLKYTLSSGNKSSSARTTISVGKAPIVPTIGNEGEGINEVGVAISAAFLIVMAVFVIYNRLKISEREGREKDKNKKKYGGAKGRKKRNRK